MRGFAVCRDEALAMGLEDLDSYSLPSLGAS